MKHNASPLLKPHVATAPMGLAAVCGSKVYSLTPNMRQAYAASVEGGATITGARDLDRERLEPNTGDCA